MTEPHCYIRFALKVSDDGKTAKKVGFQLFVDGKFVGQFKRRGDALAACPDNARCGFEELR